MTASRSGFGMPKRFVLPSAARPYIVSMTDSILSGGRTWTSKTTSSSVLFQKLWAWPASIVTTSPGFASNVRPSIFSVSVPFVIAKRSLWPGWTCAAGRCPPGAM